MVWWNLCCRDVWVPTKSQSKLGHTDTIKWNLTRFCQLGQQFLNAISHGEFCSSECRMYLCQPIYGHSCTLKYSWHDAFHLTCSSFFGPASVRVGEQQQRMKKKKPNNVAENMKFHSSNEENKSRSRTSRSMATKLEFRTPSWRIQLTDSVTKRSQWRHSICCSVCDEVIATHCPLCIHHPTIDSSRLYGNRRASNGQLMMCLCVLNITRNV